MMRLRVRKMGAEWDGPRGMGGSGGWAKLTEKTRSGCPLARMLVSCTCFSTIQASSCFPF